MPSRRSLALPLMLSIAAGCGKPESGPDRAGPAPAPFASRLDSTMADAFAKRDMPGGALVVVQGDRMTYAKGFGFADLDSKRPYTDSTPTVIGSTSKPLTALAVLRLVQTAKVALDTPIARYLPDLHFADPRATAITLRHLLTNRSGIVKGFSGDAYRQPPIQDSLALERLAREMTRLPLLFAPGEGYAYSNRGWALAGYVVQRVSGVPIEDFMRREVFEPLGMTETTLEFWTVPNLPTGYGEGRVVRNHRQLPSVSREYGPAGMIVSTPRDMAKLLIALMNDGRTVAGTQFLTPELIHEALRPQAEATSELGGPTRYGLGWEIDSTFGELTIKKAGSVGSMVSLWVMLPASRTAVAFAYNRQDYRMVPLVPIVLRVIAGAEAPAFVARPVPPFTPPEAAAVPAARTARWLGTYDTRNGDMTVSREGDSLRVTVDGAPVALVPTSDSTFVLVADDVENAGRIFTFRRQGGTATVWSGTDSLGYRR